MDSSPSVVAGPGNGRDLDDGAGRARHREELPAQPGAVGPAGLAATYALIGVCLGPIFGRVSGVFIAFLLPFLDIGIAQSPMLRAEPPGWARALPGYGADRVLLDGGLTTTTFDQTGSLLLALAGWQRS